MHRSRIGVVLIDHPQESYAASAAFWAAVTGAERAAADAPPGEDPYESLGVWAGGVQLEMQCTGAGTPARVHLDIEIDDAAAETARVLALGARMVEQRQGYAILADPGGLLFCVVPVQSGDAFGSAARTWH